jgi:NAD(P)-dependent dehydrogenase (short-subunit alcohol dehydrogenase family)
MSYFVTGATGFIGRRLVQKLLQRKGSVVYILVRDDNPQKLAPLYERWGVDAKRVVPVLGDLAQPKLGVARRDFTKLKGKVNHVFHLAAIYDLKASAEEQQVANVEGTKHIIEFAEEIEAGCLHHVSSIAAAGLYEGVFREDMFDEAEGLDHPYFRTKHDSEGLVRKAYQRPWRIYRPGVVVGDSQSGEMDKIDGPYYFFKLIQKMRNILPPWVPTIGIEGGRMNIVPVDFVVNAMDHVAHKRGLDRKCFHLTDPEPKRIGDILNIFAKVAHAPQMSVRINALLFSFIPSSVKKGMLALTPVRRIRDQVMKDLMLPNDLMQFINYPTRFDCRETLAALKDSGIECPSLDNYAWRLWDYWERHLDPDLFIDRTLKGKVKNKVVVITGGSSGIGKAAAIKIAEAGGKVVICGRDVEKLKETKKEIEALGGKIWAYEADIADMAGADKFVAEVLKDHGTAHVLINNAGRSIRRAIENSFDRFHDYERTMAINYFGALRVTLGFLPAMAKQRRGHVINISSIGVLTNAPRFSAYVASKAAMDAFTRCAASEYADTGVEFTTVNMPLVKTPMIAPTKIYNNVPTLEPEDAADLITEAIIYRPQRIATRLGIAGEVLHALAPKISQIVMNTSFRMFSDSAAAKGAKEGEGKQASADQMAMAQLMRGIHL